MLEMALMEVVNPRGQLYDLFTHFIHKIQNPNGRIAESKIQKDKMLNEL